MANEREKSLYRRTLKETIIVRVYTGEGVDRPFMDYPCRGKATGYDPHELVGDVVQGDRKVLLLYEDLVARQCPLPLTLDYKVVVAGQELGIQARPERKAPDGEVLAYEVRARGA